MPKPNAPPFDLALIIPVRDDPHGLARLLAQARRLQLFSQIIVIDDGSQEPVICSEEIELLRLAQSQGAGRARNLGLERLRCDYVMFADADDGLLPELADLVSDLAVWRTEHEEDFDFCLFCHGDDRSFFEARFGQTVMDEGFWQASGLGLRSLALAPPASLLELVRTANYPWNKIYSGSFLARAHIRFGSTPVHHDIVFHWHVFLRAQRVLVSGRVAVSHRAAGGAGRLTAQRGPARLAVFAALDPVAALLRDPALSTWVMPFAHFVRTLLKWAESQVDPALRPQFQQMARDWCAQTLRPLCPSYRLPEGDEKKPGPLSGPAVSPPAPFAIAILMQPGRVISEALMASLQAACLPGDELIWIDCGLDAAERFRLLEAKAPICVAGEPLAEQRIVLTPHHRLSMTDYAHLAAQRAHAPTLLLISMSGRLEAEGVAMLRQAVVDRPETIFVQNAGAEALFSLAVPRAVLKRDAAFPQDPFAGFLALLAAQKWDFLTHSWFRLEDTLPLGAAPLGYLADALAHSRSLTRLALAGLPQWLAALGQAGLSDFAKTRAALLAWGPCFEPEHQEMFTAPLPVLAAQLRSNRREQWQNNPTLARPLRGGARLKLYRFGRHSHRMPLAYPAFSTLWQERFELVSDLASADLILFAHPQDLPPHGTALRPYLQDKPLILLSEEPFWDSLASPDIAANVVMLAAGAAGRAGVYQLNMHTASLFHFTQLPYLLLTEPFYRQNYRQRFRDNAMLSPQDWQRRAEEKRWPLVFMSERRLEGFHDRGQPAADLVGLCAYRTRLALLCQEAGHHRFGASWEGGSPRVSRPHWHAEKLTRLAGQVGLLSCIENTHLPHYVSEKIFDGYACGALPFYWASPNHRVHELVVPGSWLNLWGQDEAASAALLTQYAQSVAQACDWEAYALTQHRLAALMEDDQLFAHERAMMAEACYEELCTIHAQGPIAGYR